MGLRSGDIAQELIDYGTDPMAKNNAGSTPLQTARSGEVVRVLRAAGAELDEF